MSITYDDDDFEYKFLTDYEIWEFEEELLRSMEQEEE